MVYLRIDRSGHRYSVCGVVIWGLRCWCYCGVIKLDFVFLTQNRMYQQLGLIIQLS